MSRNPDPSRTTTLRRNFTADMQRRLRALKVAIVEKIDTEDALGLRGTPLLTLNARDWEFHRDPGKVRAFREWLQEQIAAGLLSVDENSQLPWLVTYIASAYRTGIIRAFTDARPPALAPNQPYYFGGRDTFVNTVFAAPERISKLELIYTRTFETLNGITADMAGQMSRILAQGLADGLGPEKIARQLTAKIDGMPRARAMRLARTEVIYAHSEGQLDSFEELGVTELGLLAEFRTAGDDRVCPICAALEGKIYTVAEARGVIPVHPECRCAWVPYIRGFSHITDFGAFNAGLPAE